MCSTAKINTPIKTLSWKPTVDPSAKVIDSHLGAWTEVGERTQIIESTIEDYSYVIDDSHIIYTTVGKFCSIAAKVRINPGNHPLGRAVLHHFTYRSRQFDLGEDDDSFFNWRRTSPVTIGHDVWVGHGAIILPGVNIGTGAAIGAGAVVSKDIQPFSIVAGVPAKEIRNRFEEDIQQGLLRIKWWDWPHDQLRERLDDFRKLDAAAFVAKYG